MIGPDPIFMLTTHRSGGTLLARMLNCHPDVVIWGEHGGWINKLAEADAIVARIGELNKPRPEKNLEAYAIGGPHTRFSPWMSPFERQSFRDFAADLIRSTFTKGVSASQRWGFKEIRYHTLVTAQFLFDLFPGCRFVILRRDLPQMLVSNIMTTWSLNLLKKYGDFDIMEVVSDCAYGLAAIESGFDEISSKFQETCITVNYDDIGDTPSLLSDFLQLRQDAGFTKKAAAVLGLRTGETPPGDADLRKTIECISEGAITAARNKIKKDGIDLSRLKRLNGGEYSCLLGDHHMSGTRLSSMF